MEGFEVGGDSGKSFRCNTSLSPASATGTDDTHILLQLKRTTGVRTVLSCLHEVFSLFLSSVRTGLDWRLDLGPWFENVLSERRCSHSCGAEIIGVQ